MCLVALILLLWTNTGCAAPVRISWSTETEINTAGFNIYRGESPEGPFDTKINEQLIPPSPDPMTGGQYSYVDHSARIGKLYYYQLEEIERNGAQTKLGVTEAQASGFSWPMALVLGGLAIAVLIVWIAGAKRATALRPAADSPAAAYPTESASTPARTRGEP
jgi:hypothetical protein